MHTARISSIAIALLMPLFGAGTPVAAQTASPIRIQTCAVLQYVPAPRYPFWRPFGPYPQGSLFTDGLRIAYVNNGPQTATRVAFNVNYRGDVQHIIDAGTFSPGVTIDHTFGQFTGDAWLGPNPNSCRVVAVRYANGSVWRAPGRARPNR